MARKLRALVIGLGRVGSRFDEEPERREVWTHVGAYLALPDRFDLVGACEPDRENAQAFHRRCPAVPLFDTVADLPGDLAPDLVSICTPAETHRQVLEEVVERLRPRIVWCEKPLAVTVADAEAMVDFCAKRDVTVVVSHVRRWLPLWRRTRELVADGAVGTVRSVRVAMPNRLFTIGSHAIDLLLFLGGPVETVKALDIPALEEDGEPAVAALFCYQSGAVGMLEVTGYRDGLVVEAAITGDQGRVSAREDRGLLTIEKFSPSEAYAGYRQLVEVGVERHGTGADTSPFVAIAEEIVSLAADSKRRPRCDGADALAVQRVLAALARDAADGGSLVEGVAA